MKAIDIAISTVLRPENYLAQTLQSLGKVRPIKLVAGIHCGSDPALHAGQLPQDSPLTSYLNAYRQSDDYSIVDIAHEDWVAFHHKHVWHRASWNYWRCLSCDSFYNNGVIIFEDDIIASAKWMDRLENTINAIESIYGQNYVLAMYSTYKSDAYKHGVLFEEYPINQFFGTQGMYFPEKTRLDFASFIHQYGVKSYHIPHDILLRYYLTRMGVHLFSTSPSLVQHVGMNTTGLGGNFHQSPSFLDEIR